MHKKSKTNIRKIVVNGFGAVGYFLVALLWAFTIMLHASVLKDAVSLVAPNIVEQVPTVETAPLPEPTGTPYSGLFVLIALVVTAIIIVICIRIFTKVPAIITKTTSTVVHTAAEYVAPVIVHARHVEETPKKVKKITGYMVIIFKVCLIIIPIGLILLSQVLAVQLLDFMVAFYVGIGLAAVSVGSFVLQYVFAYVLGVKLQDVR